MQRFLEDLGGFSGRVRNSSKPGNDKRYLRRFRRTVHGLVSGGSGGKEVAAAASVSHHAPSGPLLRCEEIERESTPPPAWASLPRKGRQQGSPWISLPSGVASKIFQLLDGQDAAAARQVCFEWCLQLSASRDSLAPSWLCLQLPPGWTAAFPGLVELDLRAVGSRTDAGLAGAGLDQPLCFGLGKELRGLRHLRKLRMPALSTDRELVEAAPALSRLVSLDLSGCTHVTDEGVLGFLRNGPRGTLVALNLDHCSVSDYAVEAVADMATALSSLSFACCAGVTDRALRFLAAAKVPILRELNMGGCRGITDAGLKRLSAATGITDLNCSGCTAITDAGLSSCLQGLRALTTLDVSFCPQVTGKFLARLKNRGLLQHLNLSSCPGFSDAEACLLRDLASLRTLQLRGCVRVTSHSLESLSSLPNLSELNVSDCASIGDDVAASLSNSTRLEALSLGGCYRLTDSGVATAVHSLRNLRSLHLAGCRRLTDEAVVAISAAPMQLTHLNLTGCREVTDVGILSLAARQLKLQSLVLRGCHQLTDASVHGLESHPNLGSLRMKGCPNVSSRTINALKIDVCHAG